MANDRWPWAYMLSGKLGDFVPKTPIGARTGYEPWAHMIKHYGSYDEAKKRFYQSMYSGDTWEPDAHVHDWRLSGCRPLADPFFRTGKSARAAVFDFAEIEKRILAVSAEMRARKEWD
jgi:hypothetical protein